MKNFQELPHISGIYCIQNMINNHRYVGSSIDIRRRIIEHKSKLNTHTSKNLLLQRAWDKYNPDDFNVYILETCTKELLIEREQYYIDKLLPEYNLSKLAAGFYPTQKIKNNQWEGRYGNKTQEEINAFMCTLRKKAKETKETWCTQEYKNRLSQKLKETWNNPDYRDRIIKKRFFSQRSKDEYINIRRLYYIDFLTMQEIAEKLNMKLTTVQSIVSRYHKDLDDGISQEQKEKRKEKNKIPKNIVEQVDLLISTGYTNRHISKILPVSYEFVKVRRHKHENK